VRPEPAQLVLGQPSAVAHGRVALDVAQRAHPWDHRRHIGVAEHEAQRDLRQLVPRDPEVVADGLRALPHLRLAIAAEIARAEVALLELGARADPAGERPLVQRHARDDPDAVLGARG
jgi:hypothetical protein